MLPFPGVARLVVRIEAAFACPAGGRGDSSDPGDLHAIAAAAAASSHLEIDHP